MQSTLIGCALGLGVFIGPVQSQAATGSSDLSIREFFLQNAKSMKLSPRAALWNLAVGGASREALLVIAKEMQDHADAFKSTEVGLSGNQLTINGKKSQYFISFAAGGVTVNRGSQSWKADRSQSVDKRYFSLLKFLQNTSPKSAHSSRLSVIIDEARAQTQDLNRNLNPTLSEVKQMDLPVRPFALAVAGTPAGLPGVIGGGIAGGFLAALDYSPENYFCRKGGKITDLATAPMSCERDASGKLIFTSPAMQRSINVDVKTGRMTQFVPPGVVVVGELHGKGLDLFKRVCDKLTGTPQKTIINVLEEDPEFKADMAGVGGSAEKTYSLIQDVYHDMCVDKTALPGAEGSKAKTKQ